MEKKWKQWQILYSWAPKSLRTVTAAMKLKDAALWKESQNKFKQHFKKQRQHFSNQCPYSQSYGFSSNHIYKVDCWRINALELCWRRLLRVPWMARRPNQSTIKEINMNIHWKDWCWSSNTLATWCEERDDSLEKSQMLENIQGKRKKRCRGWDR